MIRKSLEAVGILTLITTLPSAQPARPESATGWQPAQAPLVTRWGRQILPEKVHPEYPRPQMVRPEWMSLNGLWDYAICERKAPAPQEFDGKILVPFPVECALSGIMRPVNPDQRLWYRRTFRLPPEWQTRRILLHFEAVDWQATVWVNGHEVGTHSGGYDPFSFDISDCLHAVGDNEVLVAVWDPTDAGPQPRGKQVRQPHGIWYTSTTGIWQTVWLEPVPASRIDGLKIIPDLDQSCVDIAIDQRYVAPVFRGSHVLEAEVLAGEEPIARAVSQKDELHVRVELKQPRLWSPDDPFLYDLRLRLVFLDAGERKVIDEVSSYFGMRKISLGVDDRGRRRILLNNRPCFMLGLLDQGFWPDGLYTAPTDEALRCDIEVTRQLGFNLARKHVKVEPQRWYWWADRLGLLVFQDIPSGDAFAGEGKTEIERTAESAAQFELELARIVQARQNHPCIVMWVLFNEGWGQYDTRRLVDQLRQLDPHRLIDAASGWHDLGVGDVADIHSYPGPEAPSADPNRAGVLGEFGGLGLVIEDHSWQPDKSWGYRKFNSAQELTEAYLKLIDALRPLVEQAALSAAVYTQTTDVETETNGLLTYDRAVIKVDAARVSSANRRLWQEPGGREQKP
jgi:hypothetical protein